MTRDQGRWLADRHAELITDLHSKLDLDAGIRELLAAERHATLIDDVRDTVDLEAGLAAIMGDGEPAASADRSDSQQGPAAAHRPSLDIEMKVTKARKVVGAATAIAGLIGATPLPFIDAAPLTAVQVGMIMKVNVAMGLEVDGKAVAASVMPIMGSTITGRTISKAILSFVPLAGSAINGTIASSITAALGEWYTQVCARALRDLGESESTPSALEVQGRVLEEVRTSAQSLEAKVNRLWRRHSE